MKGLDKLTPIRLAEVLTAKSLVDADAVADALYAQERYRERFVEILVSGGHITEWDLAKLVVEHFQLPFITASNYEVSPDTAKAANKELMFQQQLVPLDVLGGAMIVAMPILTSFDSLRELEKQSKLSIYPYVGLASENRAVLTSLFPDFKDWWAKEQKAIEARRKQRPDREEGGPDNWMNMFDSADAAVRDGLKG